MKKLFEYAQLIRSKNAGPFMVTIDIIFPDENTYEKILQSGAVSTANVAEKLGVDQNKLQRYELPLARAVKFSIPRPVPCGDFLDEDLYGCQMHRPIVNLEIPL